MDLHLPNNIRHFIVFNLLFLSFYFTLMFPIPLSLRYKLNNISSMVPENTRICIHNDILHVLLSNEEFVEYLTIPLLNQKQESLSIKLCYPLGIALFSEEEDVFIYVLTSHELKIYKNGFIEHKRLKVDGGEIKYINNNVVLLSKNVFYVVRNHNHLQRLHISPYVRKIVSFDLGLFSNEVIIIYRTEKYLSLYSYDKNLKTRLILSVSNKQIPINNDVFIYLDYLYVIDDSNVIVYKIKENSMEQEKRINLYLKNISWKSIKVVNKNLLMIGRNADECIFYNNGVIFNTNKIINEHVMYKGNLFCISNDVLYFLPNDPDYSIKLSGTECLAINNLKNGNNSPFVTRTFSLNGGNDVIEKMLSCYSNKLDFKAVYKENTMKSINSSLFLSFIIYHGFKIQVRKLICNVLKIIRKTGRGIDYLKFLHSFTKFDSRIYKIFLDKNVNIKKLYYNVTEILEIENINMSLLIEALDVQFHILDIDFKDYKEEYFYVHGKHLYKQRNLTYLSFLYKSNKSEVYEVFINNGDVVSLLIYNFIKKEDLKETHKQNITNLILMNQYDLLDAEVNSYYKEIVEANKDFMKFPKEDNVLVFNIQTFIENNVNQFLVFLEGRFHLLYSSNLSFSNEIFDFCVENLRHIVEGCKYLFYKKEYRLCMRLVYVSLVHKLYSSDYFTMYECFDDYVFIYKGRFIGKENIFELLSSHINEEKNYKQILIDNLNKDGIIFTDVLKAEIYEKEYKNYLTFLENQMNK